MTEPGSREQIGEIPAENAYTGNIFVVGLLAALIVVLIVITIRHLGTRRTAIESTPPSPPLRLAWSENDATDGDLR